MTRKIEYGQKSKHPQKSLEQKFTSKKCHDEFPSLKNFQEALNDILTTFETPKSICCFNNNTMQRYNSMQDHPGFMKQMQRNALNIKTAAKQVWLYFIRRTTQPGYAGTITNVQIVLNAQKFLLQATPKKFSYPEKSRKRKFQTQKYLDHPPHLKSRCTPWESK